jgi:hypothetical protein
VIGLRPSEMLSRDGRLSGQRGARSCSAFLVTRKRHTGLAVMFDYRSGVPCYEGTAVAIEH